jgi:hypothetical protein
MTNRFIGAVMFGLAVSLGSAVWADEDVGEPSADVTSHDGEQKADPAAEPTEAAASEIGISSLERAAQADKYLFAMFRKAEDEQTAEMRKVLAAAMEKISERAMSVEVDVTAESEGGIVDRFRLQYAPMPLLLVVAPNGVVTGGFPVRVNEQSLLSAFTTPRTTELLKALEEGKLVFVCVQNSKSKSRKQAMRGVRKFRKDPRFADATEMITVDPADTAEHELLENLQIDPRTPEAVTVFFGPRGRPIGEFYGETSLDELVHTLHASLSGFG